MFVTEVSIAGYKRTGPILATVLDDARDVASCRPLVSAPGGRNFSIVLKTRGGERNSATIANLCPSAAAPHTTVPCCSSLGSCSEPATLNTSIASLVRMSSVLNFVKLSVSRPGNCA